MHKGHEVYILSITQMREQYLQGKITPLTVFRDLIEWKADCCSDYFDSG